MQSWYNDHIHCTLNRSYPPSSELKKLNGGAGGGAGQGFDCGGVPADGPATGNQRRKKHLCNLL